MITNSPIQESPDKWSRGIVFVGDPAIDTTKSDLAMYDQTRDMKHLVFLPDRKPTVYYHRYLKHVTVTRLFQQNASIGELHQLAFQLCITKIENLNAVDGQVYPLWYPSTPYPMGRHTVNTIGDDDIDEVFGSLEEIQDIGKVIYRNLFLGRMKRGLYPASDISSLAMKNLILTQRYQSAEESKEVSATQNSSSISQETQSDDSE